MSITDIRNKIVSQSEEEGKQIQNSFENKVREIQKDLAGEKKKLEAGFEKELAKSLDENKRKFLSLLSREEKIKRENLKREIVEIVFQEVLVKLSKVSDHDFERFTTKVLESVPKDLKAEIKVSPDQADLLKSLSKSHPSLSVKEDDLVQNGFLIVGDNFSFDFTFKNLLRLKKSDLELELSKILF